MADNTTTALVAAVKRKAAIPTSQNLFSTNDLIIILNEELQITIVPLLLKLREEYFVTYEDFTTKTTDNEYLIPTRAIGNKLRDVTWVDSNGEQYSIPQMSPEQLSVPFPAFQFHSSSSNGFYLRSNKLVLHPASSVFQYPTLRLSYYRRPNDLIDVTDCAKIVSIDGNSVVVDNIPSTWTDATIIDIIQDKTPFITIQEKGTIDSINTGTSTIVLDDIGDSVVGDYICETGESPIPQLPVDTFPLLTQAAIIKCFEAMGDQKGLESAQVKYNIALSDFDVLFSPRVDGEAKKVTSRGGIFDFLR